MNNNINFGDNFAKKSYSQCGEDLIINYLFSLRGIDMPSYIDIGANHPWFINNTAYFYKKGCIGINLEPNPDLISIFEEERPSDESLNIGISNSESSEMDFYVMKDNTLSTFSKDEADNFVNYGKEIEKIVKIKTTNIQDVIKKYNNNIFPDFLNIDVEGLELEILQDIDYNFNYPKVICVETAEYSPVGSGKKRKELMHFIESKGYYLYSDTNLNSIYIKNEFWLNYNEIVDNNLNYISNEYNYLEKIEKMDREIKQKNEDINLKNNELDSIYNSRSWRVIIFIQKIMNTFIPIGSFQRKVAGFLFRFFKKVIKLAINPKILIFRLFIFLKKIFKKILPESIKSKIRPIIIKFNDDKYKELILRSELKEEELEKQKQVKFDHFPLISIIVPTYNTPKNLLDEMIESVINQTYSNWELCIADGSNKKEIRDILKEYSKKDNRIKIIFLDKNEGISNNSNKAINISTGEYISFLDHDDLLTPFALYEVVLAINTKNKIDVIYSDEDKITPNGKDRFCSFFKPDWSPEFLRGTMYVGHFLVVKKSLAIEVGLLNSEFDKIQDYEFMLRLSEKTNNIYHISKILYHWRSIPGSISSNSQAKGNIDKLQEKAVNTHLKRIGLNGFSKNNGIPHRLNTYPMEEKNYPLVSIIIPTKDNGNVLDNCLKSLINKTNYPNYEIILIDNNTTEKKAIDVMKKYSVKIIKYSNEFNFSEANNIGVEGSNGEYLVFLNNDTEIIEGDWIKNMLFYAKQKDVGAVGSMLLYPDNTIQHAGVVLGFRGTADHVMRDFSVNGDGYFGSLCCAREVSAVTAACIMIRKSIFEEVEGFSQHYKIIYQDVDFCLKIRNKNYRIIYTPTAKLIHHESKSRGGDYNYLDRLLLLDLWGSVIKKGDPYYNVNFDLNKYSKDYTGYNL